jgi:hypothetical protein
MRTSVLSVSSLWNKSDRECVKLTRARDGIGALDPFETRVGIANLAPQGH